MLARDEGFLGTGDQHEEDDEDNQRGLSTPRVNIQSFLGDDPGAAVKMEESSDHASYSETEEQEIADYSEVEPRWCHLNYVVDDYGWTDQCPGCSGCASDDNNGQRIISINAEARLGNERRSQSALAAGVSPFCPSADYRCDCYVTPDESHVQLAANSRSLIRPISTTERTPQAVDVGAS